MSPQSKTPAPANPVPEIEAPDFDSGRSYTRGLCREEIREWGKRVTLDSYPVQNEDGAACGNGWISTYATPMSSVKGSSERGDAEEY